MAELAAVVIGRNEGERLGRCLRSLIDAVPHVVYVDSGSTDGSVELARALGASVLALDMSLPFTMARGRNCGLHHVLSKFPNAEFVQFVDGDCEVAPGWLELAAQTLHGDAGLAAVCGRRRERYPEASIYNRLCDMEWDVPAGDVRSSGGDVMMRVQALVATGGFNETMIAGEEAELCVRLRANGWRIRRLAAAMTTHDAAIFTFRQWWRRSVRAGHAYAEGAALHAATPERYNVKPVRSALCWGGLLPLATVAAAGLAVWWLPALLLLALILLLPVALTAKVAWRRRRGGASWRDALAYAAFVLPAKPAHLVGALTYWRNRRRGRHTGLIEYRRNVLPTAPEMADIHHDKHGKSGPSAAGLTPTLSEGGSSLRRP